MGYRGVSQWSGLGPRGIEQGLDLLGHGLCLEVCRAHLRSLALEVKLAQRQEAEKSEKEEVNQNHGGSRLPTYESS